MLRQAVRLAMLIFGNGVDVGWSGSRFVLNGANDCGQYCATGASGNHLVMMPPILRLPDCAAAATAGSNNGTIWPSTPPPTKPEIMFPTMPRSKVGDAFPAATPPSAPVMRLIKI